MVVMEVLAKQTAAANQENVDLLQSNLPSTLSDQINHRFGCHLGITAQQIPGH